jgi:Coenzyme PQQ synthesis protein D (PqqD)
MSARYQQRPTIEAAPLEDGVILLDPDTNEFSVLNQTASAIWSHVARPATSEEISAEIVASFSDVTEGAARADVEATLQQMVAQRLITLL